jgi:hypothetical protein
MWVSQLKKKTMCTLGVIGGVLVLALAPEHVCVRVCV